MSSTDSDRELVALLYEDLPRWIDHLLMHFKADDLAVQSDTCSTTCSNPGPDPDFNPAASWTATDASLAISLATPVEAQTIRQILNYAKRKLQTPRMPHFLRVTMYLRICCLAIQHNLLHEQQVALGSLYHTLLHWLWECEPDWWEHCTITDNRGITSSNARVQDLLQPLQDFVSQFAEV